MISNQKTLNFSPYMAIYDIVDPKDNMLCQINELVDFAGSHDHIRSQSQTNNNLIRETE